MSDADGSGSGSEDEHDNGDEEVDAGALRQPPAEVTAHSLATDRQTHIERRPKATIRTFRQPAKEYLVRISSPFESTTSCIILVCRAPSLTMHHSRLSRTFAHNDLNRRGARQNPTQL